MEGGVGRSAWAVATAAVAGLTAAWAVSSQIIPHRTGEPHLEGLRGGPTHRRPHRHACRSCNLTGCPQSQESQAWAPLLQTQVRAVRSGCHGHGGQ